MASAEMLESLYFRLKPRNPKATLMQYTGLKDKNGVEIYEGDIVYDPVGKFKAVVEWGGQANQAAWVLNDNGAISWLNTWANRTIVERIDLEVIGNIWEHPELLQN